MVMMASLVKRVHKIRTIGLKEGFRAWRNRRMIVNHRARWRVATEWWDNVEQGHRVFFKYQFDRLRETVLQQSFTCIFSIYAVDNKKIILQAHHYLEHGLTIFGSNAISCAAILWHNDVTLPPNSDSYFNPALFSADSSIQQHDTEYLSKDIRTVWELSRCQFLPLLASAYKISGDRRYYDAVIGCVDSWIEHNPFLVGVNWANAMEVGIRSLNWIAAFEYIKKAENSSVDFCRRFLHSLYQHYLYIEQNWEYYDSRTNNHYLTNLVAYLYLTKFFDALPGMNKKFQWCVHELIREFEKQIFEEGTCYEGSTHYHKLVTELYYLAYVLIQQQHVVVDSTIEHTLKRMISFLVWCTPHKGTLVMIGDADSGTVFEDGISYQKLASILHVPEVEASVVQTFHQFGLSIIKTPVWHVTLRHHAYQGRQPAGHFHNDVGSITLSINGTPILVDPGTYVYTASIRWRNYFRSTFIHNTCHIKGQEFVPLSNNLFELEIPSGEASTSTSEQSNLVSMRTTHDLYAQYGFSCERTVVLHTEKSELIISDVWQDKYKTGTIDTCWNFTLAPGIEPVHDPVSNKWRLFYDKNLIMTMHAQHYQLCIDEGWVSPSYGIKVPVYRLVAQQELMPGIPYLCTIEMPH